MNFINITKKTLIFSGLMFWIYVIFMLLYSNSSDIIIDKNSLLNNINIFSNIMSIEIMVALLLLLIVWISTLREYKRYISIKNYPKLSEAEIDMLEEYLIPYLNLENDDFTKQGIDKANSLYEILQKLKEDNRWCE